MASTVTAAPCACDASFSTTAVAAVSSTVCVSSRYGIIYYYYHSCVACPTILSLRTRHHRCLELRSAAVFIYYCIPPRFQMVSLCMTLPYTTLNIVRPCTTITRSESFPSDVTLVQSKHHEADQTLPGMKVYGNDSCRTPQWHGDG